MARLPVRGLTGPSAVVGDLAPRAGLEGDTIAAIGGEAVGTLLVLGSRGALVFLGAVHVDLDSGAEVRGIKSNEWRKVLGHREISLHSSNSIKLDWASHPPPVH